MGATDDIVDARSRQIGFAYILLLVAIAVIGVVASSSLSLGALLSRRDAEQGLLTIGAEFEAALRSYAGIATATINAPNARGPRTLEELLRDPRNPAIKRHLRQIYADPLTGQTGWGLVKDSSGLIVGIYSLAAGIPIKRSEFDMLHKHFEEAPSYKQWVFGLPDAARWANIATTAPGLAADKRNIVNPRSMQQDR